MYWFFSFFFCLKVFADAGAAPTAPPPFWRSKGEVFNKIKDERAIIVSVTSAALKDKKNNLRMQGGGLLHVPVAYSFSEAQKYESLKEVSSHVLEAQFHPEKDQLFLHTEAFAYHARMWMKMEPQNVSPEKKILNFKVVDGHFKGMSGYFSFEDWRGQSLMGFEANYEYETLPMPKFFVEFGLEVVLQRIASNMRQWLEERYKLENSKKKTK